VRFHAKALIFPIFGGWQSTGQPVEKGVWTSANIQFQRLYAYERPESPQFRPDLKTGKLLGSKCRFSVE
jgi:hypothetical protein